MINVSVTGNLGADAELKDGKGTPVLSFNIASNQKIGEEKTVTWVRCSIWGTRAEALEQYLLKGTKVCAVGVLSVREYEANDGAAKTSLDLRVDQIDWMSAGKGESGEVTDEEFPHGANEREPIRKAAAPAKPQGRPGKLAHKGTNGRARA